jgi:hypothetical protein
VSSGRISSQKLIHKAFIIIIIIIITITIIIIHAITFKDFVQTPCVICVISFQYYVCCLISLFSLSVSFYLFRIVTCRMESVTKITGSSSDDWIY